MAEGKYHPSILPAVRNAANSGMTLREIAEFVGISYPTLATWQSKHPEFAEAIRLGKDAPNERVRAALYQSALGYYVTIKKGAINKQGELVEWEETQYIKPEMTAQVFYLKNRLPNEFNDRNGNSDNSLTDMSDAELAKAVREKAKKLIVSKAADKVLEGSVVTERPIKDVTPSKD